MSESCCLECEETKNLYGHPNYPGDMLCLDCLINYWEEKREEAEDILSHLIETQKERDSEIAFKELKVNLKIKPLSKKKDKKVMTEYNKLDIIKQRNKYLPRILRGK